MTHAPSNPLSDPSDPTEPAATSDAGENPRTHDATSKSPNSSNDDSFHKVRPLGDLICGTITLHFPGTSVNRRIPQSAAMAVSQMAGGERSTDEVRWCDLGWLQFDNSRLLAAQYDADEDLGWNMTPEERDSFERNGHPHGFLRSVVDHWRRRNLAAEPRYSIASLFVLRDLARESAPNEFMTFIEFVEGEKGARFVRDAYRRSDQKLPKAPPLRRTDPTEEPAPSDAIADDSPAEQSETQGTEPDPEES